MVQGEVGCIKVAFIEANLEDWIPLGVHTVFTDCSKHFRAAPNNQVAVLGLQTPSDPPLAIESLFGDLLMSSKVDKVAKEFINPLTCVLENCRQLFLIGRGLQSV